jgi:hypothetical protein
VVRVVLVGIVVVWGLLVRRFMVRLLVVRLVLVGGLMVGSLMVWLLVVGSFMVRGILVGFELVRRRLELGPRPSPHPRSASPRHVDACIADSPATAWQQGWHDEFGSP